MSALRKKIALVGRPNVGKSALFNCICSKRKAIVDAAEGVTRDRLYGETEFFSKLITVIDTGGLRSDKEDQFQKGIREQTQQAIEEADALILVVDGQVGLTQYDHEVAKLLLRTKKPVALAVNKWDQQNFEEEHLYRSLGIEKLTFVSAAHNYHIAELLESIIEPLDDDKISIEEDEEESFEVPKVALVGRPNAGKSTLINTLFEHPRCLVSPVPGTTRDAVDVPIKIGGKDYILVDTAGIRNKNAEHEAVDKFAAIRTEQAIKDADICLLLLDANEGFTTHDKKIASHIAKHKKPCILLLNKWDLIKGYQMEHCVRGLYETNPFFRYCPLICISALTGRGVTEIFPLVETVLNEGKKKVQTSQLNELISNCLTKAPPARVNGKLLKIYYATQIRTSPPCFVLFVNQPSLIANSYKNYLSNQLRKAYSFSGNPLTIYYRSRSQQGKKS